MKISNRAILIFILIVSAVLRFYNLFDIPFTHDEFSALFRTQFNGFSELIDKGVKLDTHPAGVQIFMYYWVKTFGYAEWVVKLPFIFFGIGAIFMMYQLGKEWFNESVGLFSAAMLATIQYTVMYSQIARPYISGLLLSLLMVYFWSKIIKSPERDFVKNALLFVFFAALCAYNHHFSLLFAAIVGLSGIFLVHKNFLLKYLLSGVLIFLLYVPHLGIFFKQLEVGGISWVAKPHADFIIKYMAYSINFSWVTFILLFTIGIYAFIKRDKMRETNKFVMLSLVLFMTPFLIGFIYSIYINTVIQYSVLIFSFPFVLLAIFGFLKEQRVMVNLLLVALLMSSNVYSLIFQRKHYEVFYESCFEQLIIDYKETREQDEGMVAIIDLDEEISSYYINRYDVDRGFKDYNEFDSKKSFEIYVAELKKHSNSLFFSGMYDVEPEVIPLIQEYFPKLVWQKNYAGGSSYYFTTENVVQEEPLELLDFDSKTSGNWKNLHQKSIINEVGYDGSNAYLLDSSIEYSMSFVGNISDLMNHKNDFIDISVLVKTDYLPEELILVCAMKDGEEDIYWSGESLGINLTNKDSHWVKLMKSVKLSDIYIPNNNVAVKIYIWNKNKSKYVIDNFEIKLREGNPRLYGLIKPL